MGWGIDENLNLRSVNDYSIALRCIAALARRKIYISFNSIVVFG